MNVTVSSGEIILDKFDMIVSLLATGFTIGVVVFVIVAAVKMGWKLAPWVLGLGLLAWIFI